MNMATQLKYSESVHSNTGHTLFLTVDWARSLEVSIPRSISLPTYLFAAPAVVIYFCCSAKDGISFISSSSNARYNRSCGSHPLVLRLKGTLFVGRRLRLG